MKAIKSIGMVMPLMLLLACSAEEADRVFDGDDQAFVRFLLLVDSNNDVVEYPRVESNLQPVTAYTKDDVRTLKIPVALTAAEVSENTTVTFTSSVSGGLDVDISPENTLTFSPSKRVDTIFAEINSRWDVTQNPELLLELTDASNGNITLGSPGSAGRYSQLRISFEEPTLQYSFATNRVEINGNLGETVTFNLNFPEGYFPDEIDDDALFEFLNTFDYSLERVATSNTFITYRLTLEEDIEDDDVFYQSTLNLTEASGYVPVGNTVFQIVKSIKTQRDNSVNTAANFYNLNDPFYRTYGLNWNDFNEDEVCEWTDYFAFTYPVEVNEDHPDAVLYDDKGTTDPSDDVYHHAFQIRFRSTNPNTTTNSFNLKRLFSNEANNYANSPGFDLDPAIEFYPENGTSMQRGTVSIVPQFLTIAGSNGNAYSIAISGSGTYEEYEPGLYELIFEIDLTNEALFGGTITIPNRLYNTNTYPEPEPLSGRDCVGEYTL